MKKLLPLILILLLIKHASAQDFEYGKYDAQNMEMKKYDKDTSAHAVVIKEFGKAWISSTDEMPLIFEYHVKIKILDSKGFKEGNIAIHLSKSDNDRFETVDDIAGITYYKDDIGGVQQSELDPKKIYRESVNKYHDVVKFAMPNLRDGCIIEYKYTVSSPYHFNFHSWEFQSDIPKMYSEYEAHIPAIYNYNVSLKGPLKLSVNKPVLDRDCFSYYGTKCDCSELTFGINDIPAFIEEDDMTSPSNYLSAINFELAEWTDHNGTKHQTTKEWKDVDQELKSDDDFGSQLKKKDYFKDKIAPVVMGVTDSLEKAKAVYTYMQKWFKWDHFYGIQTPDGVKKAFESHSGSISEINLSLVDALSAAGINTETVILSTRDNGVVNQLYPVISDFNYVVAKVNIGNKYYLLDATDPLLSFGMLPLQCINDQGRVMSLNKPSYWIPMVAQQKRNINTAVDLTLQDNGKIKGTVTNYYVGYAAYDIRREIKKFNSVDEYVEDIGEKSTRLKILRSNISGLDSLDQPVTEKYEIEMNGSDELDHDHVVFNPTYWHRITQNPFKLTQRTYPVDRGSAYSHVMTVTLHFPDNLDITDKPAPVAFGLPNNGGRFVTQVESEPGAITYSQIMQFNKAIYFMEEYPYIKELYNKIIQTQKANIVLKKK